MKCTGCSSKHVNFGLGFCRKCSATTASTSYTLCDACAKQLSQCQMCGIGVGTTSGAIAATATGPSPYMVRVTDKQDGQTITGVRTGEHVEISLPEDQYSGKEWAVKTKDWSFSTVSSGTFFQNPQKPQFGVRVFVFDCTRSGKASIEMHEVQRYWGYGWGGGGGTTPVPGGKTFKITGDIK